MTEPAGAPVEALDRLLREMRPVLDPAEWAYVAIATETGAVTERLRDAAAAWFREAEGISAIVPAARAESEGMRIALRCRRITLTVHSSLAAVGLTAAVAQALAARGIPCNVVAALRHDHVFVPTARADEALGALQALSA